MPNSALHSVIVCFTVCLAATGLSGCGPASAERQPDMDSAKAIRAAINEGLDAGTGPAAALPDPTGWANFSGVFRVQGSAPSLSPLSVNKDQGVCGNSAPNQKIEVDAASGGLKNVLLWLDMDIPDDSDQGDNAKWVHAQYNLANDPNQQEKAFDQKRCIFLSYAFFIRTGQTLRILNSDPVGHNTNIQFKKNPPVNVQIAGGGFTVVELRKQERDPAAVSCNVHPWMSASMIVRDNPYVAVTNEKGEFSIENVPAGVELKFRAWHQAGESNGYLENVSVSAGDAAGEATKWKKGRFKLAALNGGQDYKMEVVINGANLIP